MFVWKMSEMLIYLANGKPVQFKHMRHENMKVSAKKTKDIVLCIELQSIISSKRNLVSSIV